jgi:hypothetical protein
MFFKAPVGRNCTNGIFVIDELASPPEFNESHIGGLSDYGHANRAGW